MDLSVIICTWNRCHSLRQALESIEACAVPAGVEWEVMVVDNNSSDETRAVCESFVARDPERFRYLFEQQQGKAFALNSGVLAAKGDVLAFTDDDLTVDTRWVAEILISFQNNDCVAVGGKVVPVWTTPPPDWIEWEGPHRLMAAIIRFDLGDRPCETKIPPFGCNMAFKKEVFEKHGLFRTDLGPNTTRKICGEDTELGRRIVDAGERLVYAPGAVVYHPVEEKRARKSFFLSWYYDYGRALVRSSGVPKNVTRYFGVPRYMFRVFAVNAIKWLLNFDSRGRFYFKLQVYQTIGEMAEAKETGGRLAAKSASV